MFLFSLVSHTIFLKTNKSYLKINYVIIYLEFNCKLFILFYLVVES